MNDFVVTVNEKKIRVTLSGEHASIDGKEFKYSLSGLSSSTYNFIVDNKSYIISAGKNGYSEYIITLKGQVFETKVLSALQEKAANLIESKSVKHSITIIKSPMPGMILKIKRKAGEDIVQGDSLLILEAMKMENDIRAPVSGKVKEIKVSEGQAVEKGIPLIIIE